MTNLNNPFDLFDLFDKQNSSTETKDEETVQSIPSQPVTTEQTVSEQAKEVISEIVETNVTSEDCTNVSYSTEYKEEESESVKKDDDTSLFEQLSKKADEAAESKEQDESREKNNSADKKKEVNSFDINEFTVIRYFREEIALTDYFTVEEIVEGIEKKKSEGVTERVKITAEMVRSRVEKDFPEFVKGYTEMSYHKAKNFILPCVIAKKKGSIGGSEQEVFSSTDDSTSFLFPKKIPFQLLQSFISYACFFGKLKLEFRGEFYYNFDTEQFLLHIPKQTVNRFWVVSNEPTGYFQEKMLNEHNQFVQLVCEIHSHNLMKAIPSQTDNENERVPGMFYVIVGETNQLVPSLFVRTFTLGQGHVTKRLQDLFEHYECDCKIPTFCAEDITIDGSGINS